MTEITSEDFQEGAVVRVYWTRIHEQPPAGLADGAVGTVLGTDDGAFETEDFDAAGRPLYEVEFANYHEGQPGMFLCWHSQLDAA